MILKAHFAFYKLSGSDDVKTSRQGLVIRKHSKGLPCVRRLHTNEPRRSGSVVWFRFRYPGEELGKKKAELIFNHRVGVR